MDSGPYLTGWWRGRPCPGTHKTWANWRHVIRPPLLLVASRRRGSGRQLRDSPLKIQLLSSGLRMALRRVGVHRCTLNLSICCTRTYGYDDRDREYRIRNPLLRSCRR